MPFLAVEGDNDTMLDEDKTMIISNMEYHHVVKEDDNAGDNYDDDNGDDDDDQDDACRRQRSARGGAAHSCGDHCGETLWVRTNKRKGEQFYTLVI